MSFGECLRRRRKEAGVSQRALAAAAGVDFTYISKLENERLPPAAVPTIVRLARAVGSDPLELLQTRRHLPPELRSLTQAQWEALWEWLMEPGG